MAGAAWLPTIVVILATSIGAVTDVWKFRVYNLLTFPLFFAGLIYHLVVGGWSGLGQSMVGALFGFGVLIVPHLLGLMGAGDVKLMAGIGAWLGFFATAIVFVMSALAAGLFAAVVIVYRGKFWESWQIVKLIVHRVAAPGNYLDRQELLDSLCEKEDRRLRVIPFGAMMPLGVVGAIVWTSLGG